MENTGFRSESQLAAGSSQFAGSGQFKENSRGLSGAAGSPVSDSLARGRDAVAGAADEAMNSAGSDLQSLRTDLNGLKDTVTKFMSQAAGEAAKSAREVSSNVAGRVGDVASDLADRGRNGIHRHRPSEDVRVRTWKYGPSQPNWGIGRRGRHRGDDWLARTSKLMLFKILKVFGLDVPAKIEAAKSSLELRVERATDRIKEVA
jgi:ElaB/YqjD/DUF883 family membrane-anchored ribosome-binding protein